MVQAKKSLGILFLVAWSAPLSALTVVTAPDEVMVDQADLIAEVVVRDLAQGLPKSFAATDYQVEVEKLWHGEPSLPVIVRVPGGPGEDGEWVHFDGLPFFGRNEKLLVFLKRSDSGTYQLLHWTLGVFRPGEFRGQHFFERDLSEVNALAGSAPDGPRDARLFEAWVRDRVRGERREADYFVSPPTAAEREQIQSAPQGFTLLVDGTGRVRRFAEFDARATVFYQASVATQPGVADGGYQGFREALQVWNDDPSTTIRLGYAGTTTSTAGHLRRDGINSVVFNDTDGAGGFAAPFNCNPPSGVIASAVTRTGGGTHTANGQVYSNITEVDIVANSNLACFIGERGRWPETMTHEIGHNLGLGHSCGDTASGSCDGRPQQNDATMRARSHGDFRFADIRSDDRAAIFSLYPEALLPPAAPSSFGAVVFGPGTVELSWFDNANNETSFTVERRISGGSFEVVGTTPTNVTVFRDSTASSGSRYSYRARAENSAGVSAYSNEAAADTPGEKAPSNLVAEVLAGEQVRLNWIDNSTGETGFQIEGRFSEVDLPFALLATAPAGSQTIMLSDLVADAGYLFRVRAQGGAGDSTFSNQAAATTLPAAPAVCQETATSTCLTQERFEIEVRWRDFQGERGSGRVVPTASSDSGLFYFFAASNWELLVKVLDGCAINQNFWVFAAATTTVEYALIVTDRTSGRTEIYANPLGAVAPAIADISAFATCTSGNVAPVAFEAVAPLPAGLCGPGDTTLCLGQGRFEVAVDWRDFAGQTGSGQVVPVGTADSGLFYFFSPDNWEILVKVLDGCAINNHYWVFAAGTTNVEYHLKVTDTERPAPMTKTYDNALGQVAVPVADIVAFPCQ